MLVTHGLKLAGLGTDTPFTRRVSFQITYIFYAEITTALSTYLEEQSIKSLVLYAFLYRKE